MKIKKKLLLHSCCAPCSSGVLEQLLEEFDVTVFFYNPNINTQEEYDKRARDQQKLCDILSVPCIITKYSPQVFSTAVTGREKDKEGQLRCNICFDIRLKETAKYAKANGFDVFTTTLSVSPYKNAQLLNIIGENISDKYNIEYQHANFKKNNGYLNSINNSKKYKLYRQKFCGCTFSYNG